MQVRYRFQRLLLLAVLVLTIGSSLWALALVHRATTTSIETERLVTRQAVPLLALTKDVRFDVVQVQQWLTDVSATQAKDGLGDGFDLAKQFTERFKQDSDKAIALASAASLTDLADNLH
mgnify:CR=1 FL=1